MPKVMPNITNCSFCSVKITTNNLKRHENSCKGNPDYVKLAEKTCPVCSKKFMTRSTTCSYACANKYFRLGDKHSNWNQDTYRTTCFLYHEKKCIICGETGIVAVHHYDGNHKNNDPKNLIPMCPTHHQYMHSNLSHKIEERVNEYYSQFTGCKRAVHR